MRKQEAGDRRHESAGAARWARARTLRLVALLVGVAGTMRAATPAELAKEAQVPAMPPLSEFAPIWMEPTFHPAEAARAPGIPVRNTDGWGLLALIKIGAEAFAILEKPQTGLRMYVGPKPNLDGFSVESAHFDPDPEKEYVTIRHRQGVSDVRYMPAILDELKKRYQVIEETGTMPSPPR